MINLINLLTLYRCQPCPFVDDHGTSCQKKAKGGSPIKKGAKCETLWSMLRGIGNVFMYTGHGWLQTEAKSHLFLSGDQHAGWSLEITTTIEIPSMPAEMMKPNTFTTCQKRCCPEGQGRDGLHHKGYEDRGQYCYLDHCL